MLAQAKTPAPVRQYPFDHRSGAGSKKTNLPLVLDEKLVRNSGITITLDTGEVAFWQAIEQFLQVAGLTENPNPEPVKPTNSNQRYYTQQIDWGGYQPNNPAQYTRW